MYSLWNAIDETAKTRIENGMGVGSGFGDLLIAQVYISPEWDPKMWNLPAALINGTDARVEQLPHGDGTYRMDLVYPYLFVGMVSAESWTETLAGAKTLAQRLREVFRLNPIDGLTSDIGESIWKTEVVRMNWYVFPISANKRAWYGAGRLEVDFYTEI